MHALHNQLELLRLTFPSRFRDGSPAEDLPVFPDAEGEVCCKSVVVETLLRAAEALHVPVSTPDGAERISGHSLRVTGAQGFAHRGLDLWAIQLLGRWGSDAVRGYVRDAQLGMAAVTASRTPHELDLPTLVVNVWNAINANEKWHFP